MKELGENLVELIRNTTLLFANYILIVGSTTNTAQIFDNYKLIVCVIKIGHT